MDNMKKRGRPRLEEPTVKIQRRISKENADRKPKGTLIDELLTDHYKSKEDGTRMS